MNAMYSQPLVTLSIVSHGDADKVHNLLASLQMHEPDTSQFQLILTDNLGDDLHEFDSSPWASLHILRNNRQAGFAKNHNKAFQLANGKYFAILNPDLIFEHPVIDSLIDSLHTHRADLIAPAIVDRDGSQQDSFRNLPTPFEIVRRRLPGYTFEAPQPDHEGMLYPDWIAGMFWLMDADVYRRLGGMDERYRLYFEDVDFCTRARLEGMKLFVDPRIRIRHDAQRSSRKKTYYFWLHLRSAIRFFTSSVFLRAIQNRK